MLQYLSSAKKLQSVLHCKVAWTNCAVPILDFWGLHNTVCGGWKNEWNAFVRVSLLLESLSRKAL